MATVETDDKKPAAVQMESNNTKFLVEHHLEQMEGTGASAQEAITITSQSPVDNKNKDCAIGYKRRADVYLPNEQIKVVLRRAFCSMEDVIDDNTRQVEELTSMERDGNKLVDDVARVHQRQSITGNTKKWCHESLSRRDLRNLLEKESVFVS